MYMHPDVVGDIQDYLQGRDLVRSSRVNSTFYNRLRQKKFEEKLRQFSYPTPELDRGQLDTIKKVDKIRRSTPIHKALEIVDQAHTDLNQYRNQVFGVSQIIPVDMIHYLNSDGCIPYANQYLEELGMEHPETCIHYYKKWEVPQGLEVFLQAVDQPRLRRLRQLKRRYNANPEMHPDIWNQIVEMMMEIGNQYGYGPWASVFQKWVH